MFRYVRISIMLRTDYEKFRNRRKTNSTYNYLVVIRLSQIICAMNLVVCISGFSNKRNIEISSSTMYLYCCERLFAKHITY